MEGEHHGYEYAGRDAENYQNYWQWVGLLVVDEDSDAHANGNEDEGQEGKQVEVVVRVVVLADAGAQPGAVVVHSLDADSTLAAVMGPGRPVYITCRAQFQLRQIRLHRDNILNLNMRPAQLVLR